MAKQPKWRAGPNKIGYWSGDGRFRLEPTRHGGVACWNIINNQRQEINRSGTLAQAKRFVAEQQLKTRKGTAAGEKETPQCTK